MGTQTETVPERNTFWITSTDNEFVIKNVFKTETSENANPYAGGHTRTQTETVPQRGKSRITYTENDFLIKNCFSLKT